jgi:gluconate 2-dehydrogenase
MKAKVFITKPIPLEVENYIAKFCEYEIWRNEKPISEELLLEKARSVAGLMGAHIKVTEDLLEQAPQLKIISNIAVGYENFDIDLMKKRKILGTHTPFVLDDTVADLVFGILLAAGRKIAYLDRYTKAGNWNKIDDNKFLGVDIHNKTIGIVGMGRIGEKIAKRAALGFDMKILYTDREVKPEIDKKFNATFCELEQLLSRSDFVVTMTPLTRGTYLMFGEKEFKLMKNSAIFINCSRGKIVNEKELIFALQNNEIAGAGLDVYTQEPIDKNNPLLSMDNVVTTPHIGSASAATRFEMAMKAAKNLVAGVNDNKPENLVSELKDLV